MIDSAATDISTRKKLANIVLFDYFYVLFVGPISLPHKNFFFWFGAQTVKYKMEKRVLLLSLLYAKVHYIRKFKLASSFVTVYNFYNFFCVSII